MGIFGLTLYITTLWFPTQKTFELTNKMSQLKIESAVLTAELIAVNKLLEQDKAHNIDLGNFYVESQMKSAELSGKNDTISELLSQVVYYRYFANIGNYISATLAILGFILWYWKIQRYQDLTNKRSYIEATSHDILNKD